METKLGQTLGRTLRRKWMSSCAEAYLIYFKNITAYLKKSLVENIKSITKPKRKVAEFGRGSF